MKEVNPYESPSFDQPEAAAGQREEVVRRSGCVLPFVSFLIFYAFQDQATVDWAVLRHRWPRWEAGIVACAPLFCLIVWLLVFQVPIGNRLRLAPLRAVRRIPALARHAALWVALIGVVFFFHFVFCR